MTKHLHNSLTNRPWTRKEVQYLLKSRNGKIEDSDGRAFSYDCLEEHPFGNFRTRLYANSNGEWEFLCGGCRQEGIWEGLARLEAWLNSLNIDSMGLQPHYNPMEAGDAHADLGFFFDNAGRGVFYKGLIHFLYGKPGTLKSWLALSLVQRCDARFWDFENGASVTGARLRALDTPYEKAAVFDSPTTKDGVRSRVKQYVKNPPDLLVIDGFSGLAGVLEVDPDSNQDVLNVFTDIFAPLRRAGIAVLVLDHLPKDSGVDDYPIGAQAKKSQSDVTMLVRENKKSATIDLLLTKDRVGLLSQRCEDGAYPKLLGHVSLEESIGRVSVKLEPFQVASLGTGQIASREANVLESIWAFVGANPDCNQTDIEDAVRARRDSVRESIEALVQGGYVIRRSVGRTYMHTIGKPLEVEYAIKGL